MTDFSELTKIGLSAAVKSPNVAFYRMEREKSIVSRRIVVMSGALNPFDLFVLVVLALATFWGGMRGIVSQVTSILSWLASAYIATHYYFIVAKFMNTSYAHYKPLAMIVTFIVSALLIRIASGVVKNMISLAGLKEFDRQMGAALGLFKGVVLCLLVTFVFVIFSDSTRSIIEKSKSGPYLTAFISQIQRRLPESELTSRFLAYAGAIEQEKVSVSDGTESKSITNEVRDLKKYLISKVLSDAASDIVAEAEEGDVKDSENVIDSFFQAATSSVNRLKDSVSQGFSTDVSLPLTSTRNVDTIVDSTDYSSRGYDEYPRSEAMPSPSSPQFVTSDERALYSPPVQSSADDLTTSPEEDMTGLSAFFKSIGGGYGARNNGSQSVGSPPASQNRSGVSHSYDADASRSRLNLRTYTIETSPSNF